MWTVGPLLSSEECAAFLICACDVAKGSFLGVTVLGMTLVPIIYGRIFGWTMNSRLCSCAWSDVACAAGVMARVHCVSSVCVFLIHLCGRTCVFPAAKSHAVWLPDCFVGRWLAVSHFPLPQHCCECL